VSLAVPLPLHASALGKALLAYGPQGVVDAATVNGLARFTHQTIIDPAELRQALAEVRRAGIACSWGEFEADSAAAVVVLDAGGRPVAAIAIEIFNLDDVPRFQPSLLLAARTFSRGLGEARLSRLPRQSRAEPLAVSARRD
jgi:DNA-binding IclR family transcriptional regulator